MTTMISQPIAVIGMACRYPGAKNLVELWENILAKRQQFRDMPKERLPLSEYHDPDPATPDKTYGRKAAVIDGFDFDPSAYRIPKSTYAATDIVHWLALATALEALKHSRLKLETLPREIAGVILGNTLTGEETRTGTLRLRWPFVRKVLRRAAEAHGLPDDALGELEATMEELYKSVFPAVSEDTLAGGLANTIAGRICNYLDLHGGGYIVDGACSSSLISIATAADYLNQNKMDLAIAGGVDISLDTFELIGFSKATALTRDEMRVYDKRGGGFIPGEGCGMVVLKRLEDARRDGDTVYAVLRGWGVSSDGRGGITAPNAQGQTRALLRAYRGAGYAPNSLAFVEGHGTGTAVGDRIELEGIAGALAAAGGVEDHAVGVTSFKSIHGHTKAAAGIGGFIKAVIAVNRRAIPPTAGCAEAHPSFADVARGLYPVVEGAIRAAGETLRAGVSAMGFGGINCHVTLESGDSPSPDLAPSLPERSLLASRQQTEVFPLSAEDLPGLVQTVAELRQAARGLALGELVDLAAHRAGMVRGLAWRAAAVAGTPEELDARLDALQRQLAEDPPSPGTLWRGDHIWAGNAVRENRVGFLFPGQGSQQIGMARGLAERFESIRDFVEHSDAAVAEVRAERGESGNGEAPSSLFLMNTERDPAKKLEPRWKEALTRTENAQPAICVASWAWKQRLEALGITPGVVGGHSLGELTALAAAGAYGPETLVKLAALRGAAMSSRPEDAGGMGVLSCGAERAQAILDRAGGGYCVVANLNSPLQTVISGAREAVGRAVELATREGLRAALLPVSNAFHSRLVEPASRVFRGSSQIPAEPGRFGCRMFSSTDGRELTEALDLGSHLANQIVSPVDFTRMLQAMSEHCDWLVEVGPGRVLTGLARSHEESWARPCFPVEGRPGHDADFNAVLAEAFTRGIDPRWERLYDNRLVRPFVPATERNFYTNPCERPLAELPANKRRLVFRDGAFTGPAAGEDTASDLAALAENLALAARDTVSADSAVLLLHGQGDNSLEVITPNTGAVKSLSADAGIFGAVLRSGESEAIERLAEDPRFLPELESLDAAPDWTALYVPFRAAAEAAPIGVIRVARRLDEPFTPADAELVAELADRAAPALIRAYLGERRREASRVERRLAELLAARPPERAPHAMLAELLESTKTSLGAEHGAILLYDHEADRLYSPADAAIADRSAERRPLELGLSADSGIAGHVFRTREAVHTANAREDFRFDGEIERLTGARARAVDCVPLLAAQGNSLGVLLLVNRRFPGNRRRLAELGRRAGALVAHGGLLDKFRETAESLKTGMSPAPKPSPVSVKPPERRDAQPPRADAETQPGQRLARAVILGLIAERTGFAADTLRDDARLIDDLNLDSIKIGALLADAALRLGIQGKIDPLRLGASDLGTVIAAFEAAGEPRVAEISALALLLDLVAERTGFGRDCLSPEQRLLDDLNIDSIKAGALLGDLILLTQTQGRIEAGPLANATLGEIASRVQAALANGGEAPAATPASVEHRSRARWVRSFSVAKSRAPEPALGQTPAMFAGDALLVVPEGGSPLAENLARRLGAGVWAGGGPADPTLSGTPRALVVLLSDGTEASPGHSSLAAVDELAVLHRLARQAPDLWQGLDTVAFVQRIGGRGLSEAPGASAWSFAASLYLERPELGVKVIDFDPALPPDFVAEQTIREIAAPKPYHAVEYDREGKRWLRCIAPVEPEDCQPRDLSWSSRDVFLVTGGGKGITAECALALARETGAKLALIGRSPAPAPEERGELASTLNRLSEAGIEYRYYEADVADRPSLERAVAAARGELGPVTGVLHGAGMNVPRRLIDVSPDQARREIAAKLSGAENLAALFAAAPPKLFAAFTSIIGVTGMKNNAWYAYSNEAVARLLQGFAAAHPETATVSYAFSVWDEVGMGVKLDSVRHLSQMGMDAIPVEAGVRQFLRWIRMAPPAGEVIVTASAAGLATWQSPLAAETVPRRFDGETSRFEPGIELVTRVELDVNRDLYLADHDYHGSLLMPTVMGLEAMAEACSRVAGAPGVEIARIEDIRLERPIVVSPERPATIEIRALALERASASAPRIIEASIHTEQTGMEPAHFSARFVLGERQEADAGIEPPPFGGLLGIVPRTDLYGSVLFQGPLFQRIGAIEALNANHVVFATEARVQTCESPEGFADGIRGPLVLGDPYYRDTLLQAAQLSLTPEVCLPVRIGRIDIHASREAGGHYRAEAKIMGRAGDLVTVEVTVFDDSGRLIERIAGYEAKVLERRADFPTPAALAEQPKASEQLAFQRDLDERARRFGLSAPSAAVRLVPDLHAQRREARRAISRPLFHAALQAAGQRLGVSTGQLDVAWLASGKPVFAPRGTEAVSAQRIGSEASAESLGVSLSHEDEILLCVAGTGPQGCDLVAPAQRTREQWRAMLNERLYALVAKLEKNGVPLDQAGARVWSALEAAMKALDTREVMLLIEKREGENILFGALGENAQLRILTFPAQLAGGRGFIVAAVLEESPEREDTMPSERAETPAIRPIEPLGSRMVPPVSNPPPRAMPSHRDAPAADPAGGGVHSDFLGIHFDSAGENAAERIVYRFPLAFKDGANPDGTLYFVRYFEWMGRLREMALRPVLGLLAHEFTSGQRAWVTNRSWAHIERPVRAGEVMEVSARFLGRAGPGDAMVSVGFDWHRVAENSALERVATTQIEMTWARVISHGVVSPEPYPPYLDSFFREFSGAGDDFAPRDGVGYRQALERIGASLWRTGRGPASGVPLTEESFSTSPNDANLVGNIYYSKYYELQGVLRDKYFFGVIPKAYQPAGKHGGLRCAFTEVKHLRDAMPFDTLSARMRVIAVHEKGIELGFDFFRVALQGKLEKLATGVHVAAWVEPTEARGGRETGKLPAALRDYLLLGVIGRVPPIPAYKTAA